MGVASRVPDGEVGVREGITVEASAADWRRSSVTGTAHKTIFGERGLCC